MMGPPRTRIAALHRASKIYGRSQTRTSRVGVSGYLGDVEGIVDKGDPRVPQASIEFNKAGRISLIRKQLKIGILANWVRAVCNTSHHACHLVDLESVTLGQLAVSRQVLLQIHLQSISLRALYGVFSDADRLHSTPTCG